MGQIGIEGECLPVGSDSFFRLSLHDQNTPKIIEYFCGAWLYLKRAFVAGQGIVQISLVAQALSQENIGIEETGVEPNGGEKIVDGFGKFVLADQKAADIVIRFRIVRFERDGAFALSNASSNLFRVLRMMPRLL